MIVEIQSSPQLLAIFSTLVEEASGIDYDADERSIFESKLVAYVQELGYTSLLDFYYRLRYDDADGTQLRKLIESLVVHETYFFRELAALETLVDQHLCQVIATRGRARVWSAACASGEEPLTLAMLLASRGLLDRVEIVATDISESVIRRATKGRYSRRSLRDHHASALVNRYLEVGPREVTVSPQLLASVRFSVVNLLDDIACAALGRFDAILCRNVLIYFRDVRVEEVVRRLARALEPDGLLTVGVSESLLRFGKQVMCEERGDAFFYRRQL